MVDFLVYAADHDGVAPNIGVPGVDNGSPWYIGMETPNDMMAVYFALDRSWPLYLNSYFGESHKYWHPPPGPEFPETLTQAGHTPDDYDEDSLLAMPSLYRYSENFLTTPALWTGDYSGLSLGDGLAFAVRVRFDQTAFPAAKGVLIQGGELKRRGRTPTAFVDGSASNISENQFLSAVPYPFGTSSDPFSPVLTTKNGYEGRDVVR
jgi:hypothetical protein